MAARRSKPVHFVKQEPEEGNNGDFGATLDTNVNQAGRGRNAIKVSSPLMSNSEDDVRAEDFTTGFDDDDDSDMEQYLDDGSGAPSAGDAEDDLIEYEDSMAVSSSETADDVNSSKRKPTDEAHGASANKKIAMSVSGRKQQVGEAAPKQRKRKSMGKIVMARPIGRSFEECDEWDKMLITWRDQNKPWAVIRQKWEEMTGEKTGVSTIPNRYNRLKDNFSTIQEEYQKVLLEVKREVEDQFALKKWDIIASEMKGKCKARFNPDTLKRQYKKLMLKAGVRGPSEAQKQNGVVDPDFDIRVSEDEA
ncbi:hypothetical protein K431DRAFT_311100 [Polychaeton citri CBS 116435]|uniref:Uncharacterized protein n=1 Tax=Polychaeton citri CBS 116435 TaxID=1314669 RepID=A0A9P4QCT2_9PEZI|nr:hypothetical protein K431DRAFT_311100 [Polychaeton citri CBS 116435]